MLQAISTRVGDSVELFIPNIENVNNAYDGSELENGKAGNLAERLVQQKILFKKPLGQGKEQYSALIAVGDTAAIEKTKEDLIQQKRTADFDPRRFTICY